MPGSGNGSESGESGESDEDDTPPCSPDLLQHPQDMEMKLHSTSGKPFKFANSLSYASDVRVVSWGTQKRRNRICIFSTLTPSNAPPPYDPLMTGIPHLLHAPTSMCSNRYALKSPQWFPAEPAKPAEQV